MFVRFLAFFTLTLLLGGCARVATNAGPKRVTPQPEVRFAVLGDTQFNNPAVFERMMHEVDMLRPDFVIQVGDMIQGYTNDIEQLHRDWERYKYQIAPLSIPFYPVPGNHDVVTPEAEQVYGAVWGTDRYWYSFDVGPVHCIVLDTYWQEEDDTIGPAQLEWLKRDLAEYKATDDSAIFLFMHAPLFRMKKDKDPGRKLWDEEIHPLLLKHPVRAVFAGHIHEYVWEERDGITYVVLNSSGYMPYTHERAGFFHDFIHVSVENESDPRYAVVKAGSILPVDTVNSAERHNNPKLLIPRRSLRMPELRRDGTLDLAPLPVTLNNDSEIDRTYLLEWSIPRRSVVRVQPERLWVDLPAGESTEVMFHLNCDSRPQPDNLPALRVSTQEMMRTGVVSRDWEEKYRAELKMKETDPTVRTTSIPLDAPIEFSARWSLFMPPTINVKKTDTPPYIDGDLSETLWSNGNAITDFATAEGEPPLVGTEVKLLYDDQHLYIAARMEEPNPAGIKMNATGPIAMTWSDDDIELFIDPGMSQEKFFRLFENAAGTRFSSKPINTPNNLYTPEYKSAINIAADHWTLEIAIPWSDLDAAAPREGERWGLNIWRHRPQAIPSRFQWSVMNIFPYEAEKFGVMIFE